MSTHIIGATAQLKLRVIELGTRVEEALQNAVDAVERRDSDLADAVADGDKTIDAREVEIEEECLKMLALYQPVAIDLRLIVAILKLNRDLERIGDMAVSIARRAGSLAQDRWNADIFDFSGMARKTLSMLRNSLDAMIELDCRKARQVFVADNDVDKMHAEMFDRVKSAAFTAPEQLEMLFHLLSISRHLERIADHAVNIAKDVVYMVEGRIIRHRTNEYVEPRD